MNYNIQYMDYLLLQNGMDTKIDGWFTNLKHTGRLYSVNVNNINSIKLEYTKHDKINISYFVINLINKEKIYVNKYIAIRSGLFSLSYSENKDYEVVDTFIRKK